MTPYYTYNPDTKSLTVAPRVIVADGRTIVLGAAADFARYLSAYPLADPTPAPTPPEGKIAVPDGYEVQDGQWVRVYRYEDAPPPPPRRFSKLKLYAALAQANIWDPLVAWLNTQTFEGINAYTAFMLAQDLVEDHPMFSQWLALAKAALGVTDEQVEAILAAAAE